MTYIPHPFLWLFKHFSCHFMDSQNEYSTSYGTVNTSGVTPIACKYSRWKSFNGRAN